jgi:hypothetical protein
MPMVLTMPGLSLSCGRRLACLLVLAVVLATMLPIPVAAQRELPLLPDESLLADPIFARFGFAHVAQPFLSRTRYLLSLDVDPVYGRLAGRARILFVNSAGVVLDRVLLRLYPNLPVHPDRRMTVLGVAVDGLPASATYSDVHRSVMHVHLNQVLLPGETASIDVDYQITVAPTSFFYISEPFPMVAVHDETGWRQDIAASGLDYVYSESALFAVNLRAPGNVATWFVGATKEVQAAPDGTVTYTIVTGPVRNFVVIQARGWDSFEVPGGPVPIRVLYTGSAAAAQQIASIAATAMTWFDAQLGPYPYAALDMVVMRFPSGGEEYPGLIFVNNDTDRGPVYWRWITVHEVAHQWFYGIAGNDTLRHAWLDESLVQVAGYLFYRDTGFGSANAAAEYWSHIMTWYNRIQGTPRLLMTAPEQYNDFGDFMSTIYGGGAVFMRDLAELIGEQTFIAGLRAYVGAVSLGIGTPHLFYESIQAQTPIDLRPIFCQRVGIMC